MADLVKYQGYKGMVIWAKNIFLHLKHHHYHFHHEIIPKNRVKTSVDVNHPSEYKEVHLNKVRKEQNPDISNLNSMPGKLQIECPYTGSLSCAMGSINSVGNNVNTTNNRFGGLDDCLGIIENVRHC